jgi:2-amino-4-hydroxy-6-hydroxymethyldihydropteridine diphosphokinase
MIFIGIGSNLVSPVGTPLTTCLAALKRLEQSGIPVVRRSPFYETAPVPASDQPHFVNGVAELQTDQNPTELLAILHDIENAFSRMRGDSNAARTLDLDLLAYNDVVCEGQREAPHLPHPRLHERAFVLLPLCDLAPDWLHPILKTTAGELARRLPPGQIAGRLREY